MLHRLPRLLLRMRPPPLGETLHRLHRLLRMPQTPQTMPHRLPRLLVQVHPLPISSNGLMVRGLLQALSRFLFHLHHPPKKPRRLLPPKKRAENATRISSTF